MNNQITTGNAQVLMPHTVLFPDKQTLDDGDTSMSDLDEFTTSDDEDGDDNEYSDTESDPGELTDSGVHSDIDELAMVDDSDCWKEEAAAERWLSRFPGGTPHLYPQLFVVKSNVGDVLTPPQDTQKTSFLSLPFGIRLMIYDFTQIMIEPAYEPSIELLSRRGKTTQLMYIDSELSELKFWLYDDLLQTSRQLRFEALPAFFNNSSIQIDWLIALPRLVNFLGKEGCLMVHYLDIWDSFNYQHCDKSLYRDALRIVAKFPRLQHLRIVLDPSPNYLVVQTPLSWKLTNLALCRGFPHMNG